MESVFTGDRSRKGSAQVQFEPIPEHETLCLYRVQAKRESRAEAVGPGKRSSFGFYPKHKWIQKQGQVFWLTSHPAVFPSFDSDLKSVGCFQ